MPSYRPKVYKQRGGNELVVASGGTLNLESGATLSGAAGLVTAAMLEEQVQRVASVTVTSAEVLALNATPISLVAAPGAGKALIFEGAVIFKAAGTAYAAVAAGEDLAIKYTDASGLEVGQAEMTGFADQTTAQFRYIRPHTAASGISSIAAVANAALVAHMLTGEITTGDSDFDFRIYYRIVPTTL